MANSPQLPPVVWLANLLGHIVKSRDNPAFDPNKPIEQSWYNLPYKEGGFWRRTLGDNGDQLNDQFRQGLLQYRSKVGELQVPEKAAADRQTQALMHADAVGNDAWARQMQRDSTQHGYSMAEDTNRIDLSGDQARRTKQSPDYMSPEERQLMLQRGQNTEANTALLGAEKERTLGLLNRPYDVGGMIYQRNPNGKGGMFMQPPNAALSTMNGQPNVIFDAEANAAREAARTRDMAERQAAEAQARKAPTTAGDVMAAGGKTQVPSAAADTGALGLLSGMHHAYNPDEGHARIDLAPGGGVVRPPGQTDVFQPAVQTQRPGAADVGAEAIMGLLKKLWQTGQPGQNQSSGGIFNPGY